MLRFFTDSLLASEDQIGLNDYSFSNGVTNSFNLTKNSFAELADIAQFGASNFYKKSSGTLTGSGYVAETSTVPSSGLVGIFPNASFGQLAAYDQTENIQYDEGIFYIADFTEIDDNTYIPAPGNSGIKVYFTNQIGSGGADPSWISFGTLDPVTMEIDTYQSPGDPFYLPFDLSGESETTGTVSGLPFVVVTDPSGFTEGQLIKIGTGTSAFAAWITSISGSTLNLFSAVTVVNPGTPVKVCGAGFAVKVEIPTDATGGVLTNFVNCSLDVNFMVKAR